jgi:hypothetical protein
MTTSSTQPESSKLLDCFPTGKNPTPLIVHLFSLVFFSELISTGLTTQKPTASFHMLFNFEVLRESLAKRGVFTSDAMCQVILDEAKVAVSNKVYQYIP